MPFRLLSLALAATALLAATASAQTVINTVPFTISASGKYVLGANLVSASASQTAIIIQAPNVILDLNGFFVSGPGGVTTSQFSVIRVTDVSNVTIRNGTVANNGYGISFEGGITNSINHLVESVNVTRCLISSIYFLNASSGTILRRNVVSQNGGSTVAGAPSIAVATRGGVRIERNTVTDVTASNTASRVGISGFTGDFMIRNTVTNATTGINGGKYQRNLFINCTTPFTNGFDAGRNN